MKFSTTYLLTRMAAAALLILSMSACSGTRNLTAPAIDMPEKFSGDAIDSLTYADLRWWEFYTDDNLRYIIDRTLNHNRDFLIAAARMEELRQLYGVARLGLAPELSAVAAGSRESSDYHGAGTGVSPEYDLKASLNWEINLLGAQNWARKQAAGEYLASVEDYRATQMSLIAEAATAYFNLMALDNELTIVRQTLATRSESLEQARLRYEGGLTSETVYQQAKVEYATAAAMIPSLEQRKQVSENALALLMGEYPVRDIPRSHLYLENNMPDSVRAGMPSNMLQRRPDIRAAERRLESAMAAVGLRYADRFPNFNIQLTGGLENDRLSDFLKSPYTYVLGALTGPVFDFGKRKRRYKAAIHAYNQARLEYEKCVMTAFVEVQNAISGYRRARQSASLKATLRDASLKYIELARLQYRGGTLNYLDVLDAQRQFFDAQISLSNARRDEYLALVQLYKALGGGSILGIDNESVH